MLAISTMFVFVIFTFVAIYCLNKYLLFVFDLRKLCRKKIIEKIYLFVCLLAQLKKLIRMLAYRFRCILLKNMKLF